MSPIQASEFYCISGFLEQHTHTHTRECACIRAFMHFYRSKTLLGERCDKLKPTFIFQHYLL